VGDCFVLVLVPSCSSSELSQVRGNEDDLRTATHFQSLLPSVIKLGSAFVLLIVLVLEFSIFPRRDDDHEHEDETIPHPLL